MNKFFVTGNKNKFNEIKKYLPDLQRLDVDLIEIQSLDIKEIIEHKLKEAASKPSLNNTLLIVEDTGLYLDAMNNFPGPLIKFMLKAIGNNGIYKVCKGYDNYRAYATSILGVINTNNEEIKFYSGTVNGRITKPAGNYGFGWDRVFIPEGSDKTFAEMETIEEKNKYSMRKRALNKFIASGILTL